MSEWDEIKNDLIFCKRVLQSDIYLVILQFLIVRVNFGFPGDTDATITADDKK